MAFTINTNIASLQSQEYLRVNSNFQQLTIDRVTSGLRIINSGDDAAGLAIANGFRSDRTVLEQGVRNANDGLSTLQTIDGGINNISQLLDRARTLAAQSASGTFTGDRSVLNSEFGSVIAEIDRQAQAIGLDSGGIFAKNLAVFIGGGRGASDSAQITNGSVAVDLSASTVDSRSLGLQGTQVSGVNATAVADILTNPSNTSSEAVPGYTDFYFRGPGFSDQNRIRVSVNLNGATNPAQLVTAINSAIAQAGGSGTATSTAFKNAGIQAAITTDPNNNQQLVFQSSSTAFQVAAGDRLSNALLGSQNGNVGTSLDYAISGAASTASTGTTFPAASDIYVRIQSGSLASPVDLHVAVSGSTTIDQAISSLTSLVASNSSLIAAGISLSQSAPGTPLVFTSKRGENFTVSDVNDSSNLLGLGTAQNTGGTSAAGFDVASIAGAPFVTGAGTATLAFSIGGGSYITVGQTLSAASTIADVVNSLNSAFASNNSLQQAGLVASTGVGGNLILSSNNGTFFTVSSESSVGDLGFGTVAGVNSTTTVAPSSNTNSATVDSGGASASNLLSFSPILTGNDHQVITLTAKDSSGTDQSTAITLAADSGAQNAQSIDEAVNYVNQQIQASSSADLRKIVAVKERDPSTGAETIRFLSALPSFKVALGANPGTSGISSDQGSVVNSSILPGGITIDIGTQANAEAAVAALAKAVATLGSAQAVVGRGENQFNYAISLAQTQIINLNASESRIRDADLAAEAANLSKAQVLQQAGIAALAQANAAPQAVLSLLK